MKRPIGLAILLVGGCGGAARPAGPGIGDDGTYTLKQVSPGDDACYVTVLDGAGTATTHPGSRDLCPGGAADASAWVGFPVTLTFGAAIGRADEIVQTITPAR
jgi:hypothetical protein